MNLDQRPIWDVLKDKIIEMICINNPDFSRHNFQFECNETIAIVFYDNEEIAQITIIASTTYNDRIIEDLNPN